VKERQPGDPSKVFGALNGSPRRFSDGWLAASEAHDVQQRLKPVRRILDDQDRAVEIANATSETERRNAELRRENDAIQAGLATKRAAARAIENELRLRGCRSDLPAFHRHVVDWRFGAPGFRSVGLAHAVERPPAVVVSRRALGAREQAQFPASRSGEWMLREDRAAAREDRRVRCGGVDPVTREGARPPVVELHVPPHRDRAAHSRSTVTAPRCRTIRPGEE